MEPIKKYVHPQGATMLVYPDGSLAKFSKAGKATKTSATAEKLAAGHGGWVLVEGDESVDFTSFNSDREAVPGGVIRIPMKFKNGLIADLPKYIQDDNIVIQQKIDGVRAQIVFENGEVGCWVRGNSGERLKSTTAAPTVMEIEREFSEYESLSNFCVDGEIINGVFWTFDIIDENDGNVVGLDKRLEVLTEWVRPASVVKLLPTAKTTQEKAALVKKVILNNGEGFIIKKKDSPYIWGGRVEHSLKIKLVDTADCIVTGVHASKDSISLGLWSDDKIVNVGSTSTIGKGTFEESDVVEVQYLYAGSGGKLVQPTILRKRGDKQMYECTMGQLKFVNKEVVV